MKRHFAPYQLRRNAIRKALTKIKGTHKLEIGCGISPILPQSTTTIHTDTSTSAIRNLQQDGYTAIKDDITKTKLKNNSFNTIIASEVLEHIQNDKRAIKNIHKLLKEKGKLIITIPIHTYLWEKDDEMVGHKRRYTIEGIIKLLTPEFHNIRITKIGNLLERIIDYLAATNYKPNTKVKIPLKAYIITNNILTTMLTQITKITPIADVSNILITADKK